MQRANHLAKPAKTVGQSEREYNVQWICRLGVKKSLARMYSLDRPWKLPYGIWPAPLRFEDGCLAIALHQFSTGTAGSPRICDHTHRRHENRTGPGGCVT